MSALSLCIRSDCVLRATCLRYLAVPAASQSYAYFIPHSRTCPDHVPLRPGVRVRAVEDVDREHVR